MKLLLSIAFLIFLSTSAVAQVAAIPVSEWVIKLNDPTDKKNQASRLLVDSVVNTGDTSLMNLLLQQLTAKEPGSNAYFKTRLPLIHAAVLYRKDVLRSSIASKAAVMKLMEQALQQANESNDDYLVAYANWVYSFLASAYNEVDMAVMYAMYSTELNEKLFGTNELPSYNFLAEQMFRVREYDKCRRYCLLWLNIIPDRQTKDHEGFRMMMTNTLALTYHRTGNYDSAMYYYNKALILANHLKKREWNGIISGNMGQVHYLRQQYYTAIAMLDTTYRISMEDNYFDEAANALQWAAKANTDVGNSARALQQIREAIALIKLTSHEVYERNIYQAAVKVYTANGMTDSALYYSGLYQQLHDAIEKKINNSSVTISNQRLNEEKNVFTIRKQQLLNKSQLLQRNIIILGTGLLVIIVALIINRQRIKHKYRKEAIAAKKKLDHTEMVAAAQQKELLSQYSLEKSTLIENLEKLQQNDASVVQQEHIALLSNFIILTEDDWNQFKELFEKTYPLFFHRLKTKAPGITMAEKRMAALIRLQLTTRQMAAMQGISPDSVHKTRQRLRKRLLLSNDINLEEFFVHF